VRANAFTILPPPRPKRPVRPCRLSSVCLRRRRSSSSRLPRPQAIYRSRETWHWHLAAAHAAATAFIMGTGPHT
jgi:hypothetical protein